MVTIRTVYLQRNHVLGLWGTEAIVRRWWRVRVRGYLDIDGVSLLLLDEPIRDVVIAIRPKHCRGRARLASGDMARSGSGVAIG